MDGAFGGKVAFWVKKSAKQNTKCQISVGELQESEKMGSPERGEELEQSQNSGFLVLFHFAPSLGRFLHARENRSKLADFLADRPKYRYSRISGQISPNAGF